MKRQIKKPLLQPSDTSTKALREWLQHDNVIAMTDDEYSVYTRNMIAMTLLKVCDIVDALHRRRP